MKQNQIQITVLEANEGMVLTNGETYSTLVYLGVNDSPSNWTEIPEDWVPPENEENQIIN